MIVILNKSFKELKGCGLRVVDWFLLKSIFVIFFLEIKKNIYLFETDKNQSATRDPRPSKYIVNLLINYIN